jgi:Fe-S-cluster-containing dehydrogenase component
MFRAGFRAIAECGKENGAAAPAGPFREAVHRHLENPKRTGLLRTLAALRGAAVVSKTFSAAGLPLAQMDVDHRCVGCNVCETLCPVGALKHREEGGAYVLELDGAQCTGCRVCEAACYHQALHIRETVDLSPLFERRIVTLVSSTRRICRACRENILGEASEFCPSCVLSGERRDALAGRFFNRRKPE